MAENPENQKPTDPYLESQMSGSGYGLVVNPKPSFSQEGKQDPPTLGTVQDERVTVRFPDGTVRTITVRRTMTGTIHSGTSTTNIPQYSPYTWIGDDGKPRKWPPGFQLVKAPETEGIPQGQVETHVFD